MSKYFDENMNLRPELLDNEAKQAAESFVSGTKIKSAQLRRFYGDFKALERKLESRKSQEGASASMAFLGVLPLIKMAKSKVEYALHRKTVPKSFVTWLTQHVDAISTEKDFAAFLLHFEAVVGFCYGTGELRDS